MAAASQPNPNGLNKATSIVLKDGKFDLTSKFDLDAIFKAAAQAPGRPLVVHFHGGLVDVQRGINGANWLQTVYQPVGATPMFFIWESGWSEIIEQKIHEISQETIFQQVMLRVTQFAKAKVDQLASPKGAAAKGIGLLHPDPDSDLLDEMDKATAAQPSEPFAHIDPAKVPPGEELTPTELQQFQDVMKNDPIIQIESAAIANSLQPPQQIPGPTAKGIGVRASHRTLMSPDVLADMRSPADGSKGIFSLASVRIVAGAVKILVRVIARFSAHRDHGFYRTIFEEVLREYYVANVGKFLWDGMKKETLDAFGSDPNAFGGTAFLEGIKWLAGQGKLPRIVLVGHSAGAIYISRLLENAVTQLPADIKFDVVFIAPAVTFQLLKGTLTTSASRINNLRVFGMDDQLELANALVQKLPFLYPASLLYFISGVLEDESDKPLVGMQRYYSGVAPYDAAGTPDVIAITSSPVFQQQHGLDWALSTAGAGYNTDQTSHGGLDQAPELMKSLQFIIQNGF